MPADLFPRLEPFREQEAALKELLRDDTIIDKRFVILCQSCDFPHLSFPERVQAEAVIGNQAIACGTCGKRTFDIREAYSVREDLDKAVQQGLWLESLAGDIMSERTEAVWTGQMVETNEFDVLSVYVENTVLVECKDTSFGQNDLYVTAMKAEDIGADNVIVVSTRDIHQNVRDAVDRLDKGVGARRTFSLISEESSAAIRHELEAELGKLETQYLATWLTGGSDTPSAMYRRIASARRVFGE